MEITVEGTSKEVKELPQDIGNSKEQQNENKLTIDYPTGLIVAKTARIYHGPKEPSNPKKGDTWFHGTNVKSY